jgi:hypothetical protein
MDANAAPAQIDTPAKHVPAADRAPGALRRHYLTVLCWAFTLFNTMRVVAYLPTVWVIVQSGDSSQHSLWTWFTWAGANATMAAWLYEANQQRLSRAVAVNAANAAMCLLTMLTIVAYRS